MRRIIISGAALAVLVGGAVALAAGTINTYNATATFNPTSAGTPSHPVPGSIHELWTAHGNNGHNTAPLKHIVAKIYGIKTDGKDFPVCTARMINRNGNKGWNKICPKKSLIAHGPVNAVFVAATVPTEPHPPQCNPYLDVYNGGQGTQVFFFTEYPYAPSPKYSCLGGQVKTGAAPAYNGYVKQPSKSNGNTWSIDIPLPPTVSTAAGGIKNTYASLQKLDVTYLKLTRKKNGHTVAYGSTIGCKNGKRPYSFTFTAQNYNGEQPHTETQTISHTATCS